MYKFPQEDNKYIRDWVVLLYVFVCDTNLLKKFLVLITIISRNSPEHKVLLSKILLNPIFIIS